MSARRCTLEIMVRFCQLAVYFASQILDSVASVQSASDLFISLYESLKLCVQIFVLELKHVNVFLQGFNFSLKISVSVKHTGVAESNIIQLLSSLSNLIVSHSCLLL